MRRVSLGQVFRSRPPCLWSSDDQVAWHPIADVAGITFGRQLRPRHVTALQTLARALARRRSRLPHLVLDVSRLEGAGADSATLEAFRTHVLPSLCLGPGRPHRLVVVGTKHAGQLALLGSIALFRSTTWHAEARLEPTLRSLRVGDGGWVEALLSARSNELVPLGVVSRVRGELGQSPAASLEQVARRLGMPTRSLQRALSDSATTFAHERATLRIELAAEVLATTNEKVQSIAAEVGYRSVSRFIEVFRSRYGVTPAAFRTRRQAHAMGETT